VIQPADRGGKGDTGAVTDEDPGDQRPDAVATKAAKKTQALLREARSLLGRVEKVATAAGAIDDPTSHQLAAEAREAVERLTDHLVRLERQHHRRADEATPPRQHRQR
jgi:hypothetical protein